MSIFFDYIFWILLAYCARRPGAHASTVASGHVPVVGTRGNAQHQAL